MLEELSVSMGVVEGSKTGTHILGGRGRSIILGAQDQLREGK
jgi:hypothetical protein